MNIYSSGGVGDTILVLNKISNYFIENGGPITFNMLEKHGCHREPINDLIEATNYLRQDSGFILSPNPEKDAKELAKQNGGFYFNTRVHDEEHPFHPTIIPIQSKNGIQKVDPPYICVQFAAGRMHDNTKRIISWACIRQLITNFPAHKILLLGPEYVDAPSDDFISLNNKTGRTRSVLDAFAYINDCVGFIGQDGVLAYYAMMLKKPVIINWHLPNLIEHYFHTEWSKNTIHIYEYNQVQEISELEIIQFRDLISNYKNEKKSAK